MTKTYSPINSVVVLKELNSHLTVILDEIDSNNQLGNYHSFVELLVAILKTIESSGSNSNYALREFFKKGGIGDTIVKVKKKATHEIDTLIFSNNNNSKTLIRTIKSECEKIETRFKEIEIEKKINSNYLIDSNEFKTKLWDKLSIEQQGILSGYFEIRLLFSSFYKDFKEKIEEETFPKEKTKTTDKLSHRQQILTLFSIGFFDLPIFETIGTKQKGILVSHILNRTEKDSEDLIRYFNGKKKDKKFETKTPENIKLVKELLLKIGREDIDIK